MHEIKHARKVAFYLSYPSFAPEKSQITLTAPALITDILLPPSFGSHSSRTPVHSSSACKSVNYMRVQGLWGPGTVYEDGGRQRKASWLDW